jgi:cytosine deaminase
VQKGSAILHAEMDCLENAGRLKARDYQRATLYSTLSPCDMCSGTALLYKIPRIVIGENVTFRGPEDYVRSRGVVLSIVNDTECSELMREFIRAHPDLWNEDIGFDSDLDPATGLYLGPEGHAERKAAWNERIQAVQKILRDWDPIGVESGRAGPASEYDRYAGPIVTLVGQGCTAAVLAAHLSSLAEDQMGVSASAERDRATAEAILAAMRHDSR